MYLHPRRPIKPETSASINRLEATQQLIRSRQKLQFAPYHMQLQPHQSCRVVLTSLFTPAFVFFLLFSISGRGGTKRPDGSVELGKKRNSLYDFFNGSRQLMRHGKVVHWVKDSVNRSAETHTALV